MSNCPHKRLNKAKDRCLDCGRLFQEPSPLAQRVVGEFTKEAQRAVAEHKQAGRRCEEPSAFEVMEALILARREDSERLEKKLDVLHEKLALDTYWRNSDPRDEVKEGQEIIVVIKGEAFNASVYPSTHVVCFVGTYSIGSSNPWPENYAWIFPPKRG